MLRDAARPLPAAEGHQGAPRRARPRPRAAADRAGRRPTGARASRWRADGLPGAGVVPPARPTSCGCPATSCSTIAGIDEELLDRARAATAWSRRGAGAGALRRRRAGHRARPSRELAGVRPRAAAPARVQDRRRPRGRPGRAGRRPRWRGSATPEARARAEETVARARRAVGAAARGAGARPALATSPALSRVGRADRPSAPRRRRGRVDDVRELDVVGVRVEMPSNQPIVLLREVAGRALPADLDRRRRGHRDRLRPAGRRAAAAADPRPAQGRARGRRATSSPRSGSPRCGTASSTPTLVFAAGVEVSARPRTRSRWRCAPARRSSCAEEVLDEAGIADPGRAGGRGREVPRVPRPGLAGGLRAHRGPRRDR